jgi:hypothetical protein
MPLFGELDLGSIAARLPVMPNLDTEAWELPRVEILQLAHEVGDESRALLPRSMHPAVPPYVTFILTRYPESPVGPFELAQVRLLGRAGAHPRGVILGAVATTTEAVAALRERWGFPVSLGGVSVRRHYDQVFGVVTRDRTTILELALVDPELISGGDVQYIAGVNLARVMENGRPTPYLVQVDPHYTFQKAERGRPKVSRFEAGAWNAEPLKLTHPISASFTACDTDLPRIRFIMDPEIPVVTGTRRIR